MEKAKERRKLKLPSLSNMLTVLLAVIIIYFGVSFAFSIFSKPVEANELILNVIELRSSTKGLIERSKLITDTNEIIEDLHNKAIKESWSALSLCLVNKCSDLQYFTFIEQVARESDIKHKNLMVSLLEAKTKWGGGDLIKFSKAITDIDEQLKDAPQVVYKKWQEIVACNNKCSSMDDLFFGITESIVKEWG